MDLLDVMTQRITLHNKNIGIINSRQLIKHNIQIPGVQRIRDDTGLNGIDDFIERFLQFEESNFHKFETHNSLVSGEVLGLRASQP